MQTTPYPTWVLAGAAGGLAEVLWISAYAALAPVDGLTVAREITITVFGVPASGAWVPMLGVAIHFLLSLVLAAAFFESLGRTVLRRYGPAGVYVSAVGLLGMVWAMNFLVVLPAMGARFAELMPLPVTLVSKILFGLAMAAVLIRTHRPVSKPFG